MSSRLNVEQLAAMVRAKRGKRGLRDVATELGDVSASTLSRVEQGRVPDLDTFLRLCEWLEVSPADLAPQFAMADAGISDPRSPAEAIEIHLRADRVLPPETVDALVTMVRLAYEAASDPTQRQSK